MNEEELQRLRKSIHDLNNTVGVILTSAELLQLEQLGAKALERAHLIEVKALAVREIVRDLSDHYFR